MTRELETSRLRFRPLVARDIDWIAELHAKPEVMQYIGNGRVHGREEAERWLDDRIRHWDECGFGFWALILTSADRPVGWAGVTTLTWLPELMPATEIGWLVDPRYWGRGIATEAGEAGLAFGFEQLALTEILSIYQPPNSASGRVMEKLGMRMRCEARHPRLGFPLRVFVRNDSPRGSKLGDGSSPTRLGAEAGQHDTRLS